ncbi:MAG: exodeoxyribonuclease VII small subunit [Rickettsiales bacterium]
MPKTSANAKPVDPNISFEEALKELESIVRKLENGTADLDASIQDYTRGTELKTFCESKLKDARMKVETILKAQDGKAETEPMDAA